MELFKEQHINNIIFITGMTRSGKSLLCPIVSSFENTEKVNVNFFLEQVPILNYLGEINDSASKFLLQSGINRMVYDNFIGRNSNFRPDDYTSVWKYKEPMEYIQRLFQPDGNEVSVKLKASKKIFPMMIHNGLWNASIWFKALPSVKFIHMQRNPIEIVYSWMGKGYGGDFFDNPRANLPTYIYNGKLLPYFAYGWESQYLKLSGLDRIIHMINRIRTFHQEAYDLLSKNHQNRILFVRHKNLIVETKKYVSIVSDFVGESPSKYSPSILLQENCPRVIDNNEFNRKTEEIKNKSSKEAFNLLMEMHNQFESEELAI